MKWFVVPLLPALDTKLGCMDLLSKSQSAEELGCAKSLGNMISLDLAYVVGQACLLDACENIIVHHFYTSVV